MKKEIAVNYNDDYSEWIESEEEFLVIVRESGLLENNNEGFEKQKEVVEEK